MRPRPSFLPQPPESWAGPGRVQLRTLVLLRWMAVAGQTAALIYVRFGLVEKIRQTAEERIVKIEQSREE